MTEPTQSVTVRKVVKLPLSAMTACQCGEFTISSCSEEKTRDVHSSSLLIDIMLSFSDVSLRRQASMTELKIPGPFYPETDVVVQSFWLGKRMLRVICSAGSVLR